MATPASPGGEEIRQDARPPPFDHGHRIMEKPASSMRRRARRWLVGVVIAIACFWVFVASPVFVASMLWQIVVTSEVSPPGSIVRVPGLGGDRYLLLEDAADGYRVLYDGWGREVCIPGGGMDGAGDGRCPDALADAFFRVTLWSKSWFG